MAHPKNLHSKEKLNATVIIINRLPWCSAGQQSTCNAGDLNWDPWVGKIHWRRERLPTPVFWPGEFHGLYSPWGHKQSDTTFWAFLMAQMVKNPPAVQKTWGFNPWVGKIPWIKELATWVFWLGEFHGQRSLVGFSPWGHKESDTIEWLKKINK